MNVFFNMLPVILMLFSISVQAAHAENTGSNPELSGISQAYSPGMGEIMAGIQLRHAKLWYAGKAGNWKLAEYEFTEILEGFSDVKKYQPDFNGRPIAEMIGAITSDPVKNLGQAIKLRNKALFVKSFDGLSHACNACHTANGFDFIHIQRPVSLPFTNQRYH